MFLHPTFFSALRFSNVSMNMKVHSPTKGADFTFFKSISSNWLLIFVPFEGGDANDGRQQAFSQAVKPFERYSHAPMTDF